MNLKETIGKGTLELVVMSLLSEEDMYGYQITQNISERSNGLLNINMGALYTSLYKLENDGYITGQKQTVKTRQVRIYYHLTDSGHVYLKELLADYTKLQNALNNLLNISF